LLRQLVEVVTEASHDDILIIRVDVVHLIDLVLRIARDVRLGVRTGLALSLRRLAYNAGTLRMRQTALALRMIGAEAVVSMIGALQHMALVTIGTLGAEAKGGESTADRSSGRDEEVGVAACRFRAVAAEEILAGGHTVIGHLVGHVAIGAESTCAGTEEVLADCDFVGVMSEMALRAVGAGTCTIG